MKDNFTKHIKNDLYLSDSDIEILEKYEIDYLKFKSVKELMFQIEMMLRNSDVEDDLEDLLIKLSDYNYYFQTNKWSNSYFFIS